MIITTLVSFCIVLGGGCIFGVFSAFYLLFVVFVRGKQAPTFVLFWCQSPLPVAFFFFFVFLHLLPVLRYDSGWQFNNILADI